MSGPGLALAGRLPTLAGRLPTRAGRLPTRAGRLPTRAGGDVSMLITRGRLAPDGRRPPVERQRPRGISVRAAPAAGCELRAAA